MPTRILREGIITSELVDKLSERAEVFYRRLMSVADDYGRYYAHPSLLRAACYPLRIDRTSEAHVKQALSECEAAGLVTVYGVGKYLQIANFKQQTRAASKFPQPAESDLLSKCKADAKQMCSESESESESDAKTNAGAGWPSAAPPDFESFWNAYPRRVGRKAALKAWLKAKDRPAIADILAAIAAQSKSDQWTKDGGQFIPHPATWLNQGRWADQAAAKTKPAAPGRWIDPHADVVPGLTHGS